MHSTSLFFPVSNKTHTPRSTFCVRALHSPTTFAVAVHLLLGFALLFGVIFVIVYDVSLRRPPCVLFQYLILLFWCHRTAQIYNYFVLLVHVIRVVHRFISGLVALCTVYLTFALLFNGAWITQKAAGILYWSSFTFLGVILFVWFLQLLYTDILLYFFYIAHIARYSPSGIVGIARYIDA